MTLIAVLYMWVMATAYCDHGHTATGSIAKRGTIAVDPHVIPFRSRLRIPGYGKGMAFDTGRLIKGKRIDVWLPICSLAREWGRKRVLIAVR